MADLSQTAASVAASTGAQRVVNFLLGESVVQGDVIYLDASTNPKLIFKSDANGASAKKAVAGIMLTAGSTGQPAIFASLDPLLNPGLTVTAGLAYFLSANPGKICPAGDHWVPTTTTYLPDGLHPNALGYTVLANREIPLYAAVGCTPSGPTSGAQGSPSSNFTVTLADGATFTGDQTVTISDGGDGGTITPSVGSPGTSSVTVTPTSGLTSFTFTYTPASSGAKTLSFTNGQSWTDPAALTYTAASSTNPAILTGMFFG